MKDFRDEFEAWYAEECNCGSSWVTSQRVGALYRGRSLNVAWSAWQAALTKAAEEAGE